MSESKDEHVAVGQSKISHEKRFRKMLDIGDLSGKKVLDVGCGLGAFYAYTQSKGIETDYHGFDINEMMLEGARKNYPELAERFRKTDIIEERLSEKFDYIISVGPLNLFLDEKTNYDMTFKLMDNMFEYALTGFALSMTSVLSRKKNNDTFYYDPELIIKHISKYCNNYRIDHSYLPHDFTIFCYKDDFYSSFK
jgi:SAM-dependent methyltransferase